MLMTVGDLRLSGSTTTVVTDTDIDFSFSLSLKWTEASVGTLVSGLGRTTEEGNFPSVYGRATLLVVHSSGLPFFSLC